MAYSPIEESYMNGFVSSQFATPEPEPVLLAQNKNMSYPGEQFTDTGGGAAVGTRLKMPSGLNTPENMQAVGNDIPKTVAGVAKGMAQGFVGLPGDLEGIGRLVLNYMGADVNQESKLPTTQDVKGFLDQYIKLPELQTGDMSNFETAGEWLAPGGQLKVVKPVAKALKGAVKMTEGLPVGLSIKDVSKVADDVSYRGEHTAPMRDGGAPLSDITGGGAIYPDDVYSLNGARYYGDGSAMDQKTFAIVNEFKGKPDAEVTIYRAIPAEPTKDEKLAKLEKDMAAYMKRGKLPQDAFTDNGNKWYDWAYAEKQNLMNLPDEPKVISTKINRGDWVTINRDYAKNHGEGALNGKYKIISKKVKAGEIYTNGDSINEWGYDPKEKK